MRPKSATSNITASRRRSPHAAGAQERQQAQTNRALAAQIEAQHCSDRGLWQATRRAGWWDQADETDVVAAWSAGVAWANEDPDAGAAVQEMRGELGGRYQIDVEQPDVAGPEDPDTASVFDTDPDRERVNRITAEAHPVGVAGTTVAAVASVDTDRRDRHRGRRVQRGADKGR